MSETRGKSMLLALRLGALGASFSPAHASEQAPWPVALAVAAHYLDRTAEQPAGARTSRA